MVLIPIAVWGAWHFQIKNQYDHVRANSNSLLVELKVNEANVSQLHELERIRVDWELAFTDSGDMDEVLRGVGFENDLDGLQAFWQYEVPKYSFFHIKDNQLALAIGALKSIAFPTAEQWWRSDEELFFYNSEIAIVYRVSKGSLIQTVYSRDPLVVE